MLVPWTIGEIETAKSLLDKGYSAAQIAFQLKGRTRNSVIGMFHRQKIKMAPRPPAKEQTKRLQSPKGTRVPKKPSPIKVSKLGFIAPRPHLDTDKPKPTYKPLEEHSFERMWEPVSFRKITHGQCLWIIGEVNGAETMYCGEPIADIHKNRSWCQHHYLRVFPTGGERYGKKK